MATVPSPTWQMLEQRIPDKLLPKGLDAAWDVTVGLVGKFVLRRQRFLRRAEKILWYL